MLAFSFLLVELELGLRSSFLFGAILLQLSELFLLLLDALPLVLELLEKLRAFLSLHLHLLALVDECLHGLLDLLLQQTHVVFHFFNALLLTFLVGSLLSELLLILLRVNFFEDLLVHLFGLFQFLGRLFVDLRQCLSSSRVALGRVSAVLVGEQVRRELVHEVLVLLADAGLANVLGERLLLLRQLLQTDRVLISFSLLIIILLLFFNRFLLLRLFFLFLFLLRFYSLIILC